MADNEYKFAPITNTEVVEELAEDGHVLALQDDKIVRVPSTAVGGGGGSAAPVMFYVSSYVCKDSAKTEYATAAEIVDAYFAGTAYMSVGVCPQKITGFMISTPYAMVLCNRTDSTANNQILINGGEDALTEALTAYFS